MKSVLFGLSVLLALIFILAACQQAESEQVEGREETEIHTEKTPETIEIIGIAGHYHKGDPVELTAVLDKKTEYDDWYWYTRSSADAEWEIASGQKTETFTSKASDHGLEIKAVLYNEENEPAMQSAPVEVLIDDHHGADEESKEIYEGYFEDSQVKDRALSDWEGDWQSIYPYLLSGELDEVFEYKAEDGDMTAEKYKAYYSVGYKTDVERIVIESNTVTFFENGKEFSGEYTAGGYEILTYEAGNRGVRFVFELVDGSEDMPQYIQFSDHDIYPTDAHHYHLYWGDDREELLEEVTNWPTYYPSDLDADGLVRDMLAH